MKMKIFTAKRDDIIKDRDAYLADKANRQEEFDKQEDRYETEYYTVIDNLKIAIKHELGQYSQGLNMVCDTSYNFDTFRVRIDNGDNPHDNHALNWSYTIQLDSAGNVLKETNSWSGLSATTQADLDDLKYTYDTLVRINEIDWKDILRNHIVPNYNEYVTAKNPKYEKAPRDFDRELLEDDVESLIGDEDKLVYIGDLIDRNHQYASIVRETPKNFKLRIFNKYYIDDWKAGKDSHGYDQQVSKDKFYKYVDTSNIVER